MTKAPGQDGVPVVLARSDCRNCDEPIVRLAGEADAQARRVALWVHDRRDGYRPVRCRRPFFVGAGPKAAPPRWWVRAWRRLSGRET